ncbi:MAG TPA: O-antigen ligase [Caulobacteraceae bacterium]|nr:O-antigen ligase [Caulobacteraceae bacterium]
MGDVAGAAAVDGSLPPSRPDYAALRERGAFWACVALALVFSQCWIMPLTGPGPDPIDPAISASIRNYFFPVYAVVLGLSAARFWNIGVALLRSPALVLLLAVTFASVLWSIDPEVTSRRGVAALMTTLAGVMMAERFTWPKFLEVFATAFGIVAVLCFVFALVAPTYGKMTVDFPGAWRGVWGHKNLLGYYMSVAIAVFAASAIANPPRRWLWIGAMGAAFTLLLLSTSKTSLVSCLIGACCIPLVALARRGRVGAVAATYLWVSALLSIGFLLYAGPDLLLGLVGKDETLTGRTQIWGAVLHQIALRPVTGYGFGAVWDDTSPWGPVRKISQEQGFIVHEAHNTWLGLWLDLGYLGLAAWALLFVGVWARAMVALYRRPAAYFILPFLTVFSLHTFTEAAALSPNDLIWLMFAATAVKLALPEGASRPDPRGPSPIGPGSGSR